jgi:pimeloyl-ACP methyl ester carboxylesterase
MKFVLFAVLTLGSLSLYAQNPQDNSWAGFLQHLNVAPWQGRHFKMTAAVRADSLDDQAWASLWMRIDKADYTTGFFDNMKDRRIRSSQWNTYTIEGTIDKDAKSMIFGGLYQSSGYFYYDDFHLYIENKGGKLEEVPIKDPGFEQDMAGFDSSWSWLGTRPDKKRTLVSDQPEEGRMAVKVDGTRPVNYGDNDSAGHYTEANGIKLYYETYGEGKPLLLLHGNSGSIVQFSEQIIPFSKHYKVIAVDTRGQGKSGEDNRVPTYDLFADDMNALLDQLHLDSLDILGWSDGGNTGLIMAMKYPAKVHKLAVMGAVVYVDTTVVSGAIIGRLTDELAGLKDQTAYRSQTRKKMVTLLLTEPQHRMEELEAIKAPVLVMAGERDIIKEGHTRQIADHIKGSQLVIFPGGNHYEPIGRPWRFNQTVLEFLKD